MRILVTSIGSMSAPCVISTLHENGYYVVGTDIYPGQWHYETRLCDVFCQAPYATDEENYLSFLISTCRKYNLGVILPLTDLEIDVLDRNRHIFEPENINLSMPAHEVIKVARNKYTLYNFFKDDINVPSIKTVKLTDYISGSSNDMFFPCVAKTINGRSSEGLIRNASLNEIRAIEDKSNYILQEQIRGEICTVDYVRTKKYNYDVLLARIELLRTKNGAGMTIKTFCNERLSFLASYIGKKLDINGAVNMEFIHTDEDEYYLIDLNPRFSAGIAYSKIAGYDLVTNHFRATEGKMIDPQISLKEFYITKYWKETIL